MIHFRAERTSDKVAPLGIAAAAQGQGRSHCQAVRLKKKVEVEAIGSGCMPSRVLMLILLLACLGCQSPSPMPLPQPIYQPISQPIYQPISQPVLPISLSGSAAQQATIKAALARCTFPFNRLKPGLQQAGMSAINISWRPMSEGSLGWASTGGEVAINNSINGLQAQRTAIMELGHSVDFFYLTPEMRKAIIRLWHPELPDSDEWFGSSDYWNQIGEAYSTLFLWAFTDEEMWFDAGYAHKPSKELASQLRALLLPETAMRRR